MNNTTGKVTAARKAGSYTSSLRTISEESLYLLEQITVYTKRTKFMKQFVMTDRIECFGEFDVQNVNKCLFFMQVSSPQVIQEYL